MSEIVLRSPTTREGARILFENVDLRAAPGACLALTGPDAGARRALLRVAAGLSTATQGKVLLGDRDVTDLEPADRGFAYIPAQGGLYPHLTVRASAGMALHARRLPKAETARLVEEAAAAAGASALLDTLPERLSAEECFRASLARALAGGPEALLLDEPFARVEPAARIVLRTDLMTLAAARGLAVIVSTDDFDDAAATGDRVAVLADGRVVQEGAPADLHERPATRLVASLGAEPANFLEVLCAGGLAVLGGALVRAPAGTGTAVAGVRPQDLRLAPRDGTVELAGRVLRAEAAGGCTRLLVESAGRKLRARFAGSFACRSGDAVRLCLDPHRLLWFSAGAEGAALEAPCEAPAAVA